MEISEITSILQLSELENRDWSIFKTSAVTGEGLGQAFDWLVASINKSN